MSNHQVEGENVNANTSFFTDDGAGFTKYISDEVYTYLIISIATVIAGIFSVLGTVTNTLNVIVFIQQGVFSDSSTVSLFCLGVAEFLASISMLWVGITFCVARLEPSGLNWEPMHIMYMTASWPHLIFALITRMVTAFISFERCFCVVFPFKVKKVFSPKCSFASMVSIFAYYILSFTPVYVLNTFHFVTDPVTNGTRLVLREHPDWQSFQTFLGYANIYSLNLCSVIIVLICTTITVSRVKLSSAWRESMSTGNTTNAIETDNNSEQRSNDKQEKSKYISSSKMQKEKKLIKMITLISTIFLICYLPSIALPVIYSYDREIRTDGKYRNLAWTLYLTAWCTETFNSSINIFIYYRMSSKFKKEFDKLFGIKEK